MSHRLADEGVSFAAVCGVTRDGEPVLLVAVNRAPSQPIFCQPSVRGAVVGGVGISLLTMGLWRVDGVLGALGLGVCVMWGLCWLLCRLNLTRLEVWLDAPSGVAAGALFPLVLTLVNRRRFWDAFGLRMELELPGKSMFRAYARWVPAGVATDIDLRVTVPQRACVPDHPVRIESDFPFGWFLGRRMLVATHELLVFPRPVVPRGLRALGVLMDASPLAGASAGEAAGEPRGPRPWRPGDRMRRIHWPASIRSWWHGAGLIVRETEPPGFHPRRCMVLFHSFGADGSLIRPDRFERALSQASGVIRHLHGLGIPVRLMADFDGWTDHSAATRAQLAACQEVLARAVRARGTEAHDLQSAASRVADDELLVALSDMPSSAWRASLPKLRLPPLIPEIRETKPPPRLRPHR